MRGAGCRHGSGNTRCSADRHTPAGTNASDVPADGIKKTASVQIHRGRLILPPSTQIDAAIHPAVVRNQLQTWTGRIRQPYRVRTRRCTR